jgi:tetratricopeptide (TPR) repeat protein
MRWASMPSPAHRLALLGLAETAERERPDSPAVQAALAGALDALGRQEEALDRLASACARFPDQEKLHSNLASALAKAGRIEAALEQARRWEGRPWAAKLEFRLLLRTGRTALLAEREAALASADPADPDLLDYRATRRRDSPEALLSASEEVLAADPSSMHALHHKAVALALLGERDAATALMALDRFVQVSPLELPDGFESMDAFNRELGEEIVANPTLHPDPAGHATRKGLRTAAFPLPEDRAGPALIAAIRRKVADYADGLAGDHPFVAARPAEARFTPWALVFRGSGHQVLHHHPGQWLTGVYYVAAPAGPERPGALRVGGLPGWTGARPPWPVTDVAPVPGRLILFPSYVPHETLPTGSDETRISVAFDVADVRR